MRSTSIVIALSLATALVAGGCKKAEEKKAAAPPPVEQPKAAEAPKAGEAAKVPTPTPTPVADATTLKLASIADKVGDKRTKTDDIVVDFEFDVKGKKVAVKSVDHKEETTEVLAVEGTGASKVKASYAKMSAVQTMDGKDKNKPQILDGKSYIVWVEGGAIKATTADGAAVSADELKELADKNDDLGKPDVIEELLAGRTWKIGETYVFTADDLAKLKARSASQDKPVATEMSLTLEAFDATEGRFALTTTLVQTKGADQLTFAMKGLARVELPSNRGLEMSMSGVISGTMKTMATTGTMTAKTTYAY